MAKNLIFRETGMTRYLNAQGPFAGYRPPYSGRCAHCAGQTLVLEALNGGEGILTCPKCSERPDVAFIIARVPNRAWIAHATDCTVCEFPHQICEAGRIALQEGTAV